MPLLVWTIETFRRRNPILADGSRELRLRHDICLFPFAWYYLFPFRQKLGAFAYNVASYNPNAPTGFAAKAAYYPLAFVRGYLGLTSPVHPGFLLAVAFVAASVIAAFADARDRRWRGPFALLVGTGALFYVLMSFCNPNQEYRMAITWVANAGTLLVVCLAHAGQRFATATRRFGPVPAGSIGAVALALGAGLLLVPDPRASPSASARAFPPGSAGHHLGDGNGPGQPLRGDATAARDPARRFAVAAAAGLAQ